MARAGVDDVRDILDYDTDISLVPFIRSANILVDYVNTCDTGSLLSTAHLKEIEILLAAHFYSIRDQIYSEKKTGDASARFQTGEKGKGSLDINDYGRQAMLLDVTGCLAKLNQQAITGPLTASLSWLGKPVSTQIDYEDRD